ncbi:MAG: dienelactone hydrolase family protein [Bryobacteraceae bacterium]|nr:dienelactone hydrolase family protein [Bryobacteraceae bacterium]
MNRTALLVFALVLAAPAQEDLFRLLSPSASNATARINAQDKTWEDWVRRTGERPPDFSKLRSQPLLPDPLEGVKTRADWPKRREWIRAEFQKWVFGTMPPRPDNLQARVLAERKEGDVTVRDVLLEFGPGRKGTLHVQLVIPPGKGPFPVFLTNHPRTRPWIVPAVRRGYIGAIYNAADPIYGAPDDSDAYIELYPQYDMSAMARWAWAGSRAVDYLVTLPEVDKAKIGISGHSRNGKQAMIAAAMDDRIAAAVPSSGNTGEGTPWRYTTDMFANETLERITGSFPGWFHPRLRFFAGHEDRLPVDQNMLGALIAPRGLMLASSYSEGQGAPFAFEENYRSVRKVYDFLGAPGKLALSLRAGEHATTAEDIEEYVDFFDSVFGRSTRPVVRTELAPRPFTAPKAPQPPPASDVAGNIRWALGDAPPEVPFPNRKTLAGRGMTTEGWLGMLYNRPLAGKGFKAVALPFGDDLKADVYVPDPLPVGKMPVVIWLHAFSHATGYSRDIRPFIELATSKGFAVLAYDQIGYGSRIHQATRFYERYPNWSLLGKMVSDARAAVSAAAAIESFDSQRIYLAGYALGGKVAIWTAALDTRPAGVFAASAFTPLRTANDSVEGIAQYTQLHQLVPRFRFGLSTDYSQLLKAIAPRPVYVRAPTLDRYAILKDIQQAVQYAGPHVTLATPVDYNRFRQDAQREAVEWLERLR